MLRLTHTPVRIVPLPQAADSDFGTLYADRDRTLWVVSTDVFQVRNGVAAPWPHPQLGPLHARNIFRDRSGALWIGTDGDGLIRISGRKDSAAHRPRRSRQQFHPRHAAEPRRQHVVRHRRRREPLERARLCELPDARRALLLQHARAGGRPQRRPVDRHRSRPQPHAERLRSSTMPRRRLWPRKRSGRSTKTRTAALWFGTRSNGLYRWKANRLAHYTTAQGLASNSIYQIVEDRKGGMWLSGPNGISLLRREELDEAADDPSRHLSLTLYAVSDEVETTQIYGGRQPSGCVDADDSVWFPSNKGPIHITRDTAPPLPLPPGGDRRRRHRRTQRRSQPSPFFSTPAPRGWKSRGRRFCCARRKDCASAIVSTVSTRPGATLRRVVSHRGPICRPANTPSALPLSKSTSPRRPRR